MSQLRAGQLAEQAAAEWLERQGFQVLDINWRTPACEIDIVAKKRQTIYFTEVKYRRNDRQGAGLDYITPAKLSHMQRAAAMWCSYHDWTGRIELAAIEVSGEAYEVTDFIEALTL